jgi:hypothetical protein
MLIALVSRCSNVSSFDYVFLFDFWAILRTSLGTGFQTWFFKSNSLFPSVILIYYNFQSIRLSSNVPCSQLILLSLHPTNFTSKKSSLLFQLSPLFPHLHSSSAPDPRSKRPNWVPSLHLLHQINSIITHIPPKSRLWNSEGPANNPKPRRRLFWSRKRVRAKQTFWSTGKRPLTRRPRIPKHSRCWKKRVQVSLFQIFRILNIHSLQIWYWL